MSSKIQETIDRLLKEQPIWQSIYGMYGTIHYYIEGKRIFILLHSVYSYMYLSVSEIPNMINYNTLFGLSQDRYNILYEESTSYSHPTMYSKLLRATREAKKKVTEEKERKFQEEKMRRLEKIL